MPDKVCEWVSLTHQRADTLVSDNERVVVTGNVTVITCISSINNSDRIWINISGIRHTVC